MKFATLTLIGLIRYNYCGLLLIKSICLYCAFSKLILEHDNYYDTIINSYYYNYDTAFCAAILLGKPSPPHEVIVYLEDNTDIDEIMFLLQWSHSITLFDNMYNRSQISTLSYIVYGYFNDTKTLSDEPDIFYRNKTRALVHRVQLDAHDCRFKEALFSVSAEFEEVGEGAMSTPEKNVNSSDGKICSSGKQTKFTTNHVTVVVLVGTIIITLLLILLIVSIVLLVLITCHQRKKRQKVQINLQPTSTANINMDKNSAYELRNFRKGVLQCHPNSAYSSVGKYNKSHRSSIL